MKKLLFLCISLLTATASMASHTFTVDSKQGAAIPSTMYGVFFEDINFAADGGLYAELIANRSFEYPVHLQEWKVLGNVEVRDEKPAFSRNPHYARLSHTGHWAKQTGLENRGFFGIGIQKGKKYNFSVYARKSKMQGDDCMLRVDMVNSHNDIFNNDTIRVNSGEWKKYTLSFTAEITEPKALVRLLLASWDGIDIDHVSLMPADNWNGMRRDLVEQLEGLKPGVFRFPGGCIVEGTDLQTRYQWKNTVGEAENRPINENRWNYNFDYRPFPNYYQSYGLGFYEYFLLSEHLGAAPLPVISCGMACQFQNGGPDTTYYVKMKDLQPYIDDALDLIEFANGSTSTKWGAIRAKLGHPQPFGLKYLAVGNEQWDSLYFERLEPFAKQIRAKYPDIQLVGSSGPYLGGEWFDDGWKEMRRLKTDLVDEHYYVSPQWFLHNANRYDNYPRKGPKVFAGEYAAHEPEFNEAEPTGRNTFNSALTEAAFMTGLERNADIVEMATYAPLFAHVEGWQWRPDLIWFDNLQSVRTPNYYVQQLYSLNKGTNMLKITENGKAIENMPLFASAVYDKKQGASIVKIVNAGDKDEDIELVLQGVKNLKSCTITQLHGASDAINTIDKKDNVVPMTKEQEVSGNKAQIKAPAHTFLVVTLK